MSDRRLLSLAREQHGLVRRDDVTRAGLSSWQWCARTDAREWLEAAPGIWHHCATPLTWEMRLRAGLLHLGARSAIFGRAATAWWELDDTEPGTVEFVVPRARRERALPRHVHTTTTWTNRDLLVHRGLRCTSVTRTILDLAAVGAPPRSIESAIDSGVRKRLTAVPVLVERAHSLAARGRRGTGLVLELLLDAGGESALERRFLRLMRGAGIARPRCQVVLRDGSRHVARVDFQFTGTRLIVEVSGRLGHASDSDRARDARRRNELTAAGWDVREFTTADVVEDPDYVVATIRQALATAHRVAS